MMKIYHLLAAFILTFFFNSSSAQQFFKAEIGVDGLTCSMCTRSTELSIRKLDFVESVKMDLANTNGVIVFKKGMAVSIEKIAQAVKHAGFSVRYLKAYFVFSSQMVSNGSCFEHNGTQYKFVGKESKTLRGETLLTFVGKEYMSAKEFKKWAKSLSVTCGTDKKNYYVTL